MILVGACHSRIPNPKLVEFLTWYGGLSLYGDPNYRLVWSGNHGEWSLQKWADRDANGRLLRRVVEPRWALKYRRPWQQERWIVERLVPASVLGSPDEWRRGTSTIVDGLTIEPLGGYPYRGDYRGCDIVEDDGGYVEPTEVYLKGVIDRMRGITDQTLPQFLDAYERVEEQRKSGTYNNVLAQIKDANRPFANRPRVWTTGLTPPTRFAQKEH